MAVNKIVKETSISIEVQNGVDKTGDPIYTKKTFSNLRNDAEDSKVYDVAEAIKSVIDADTRDTFINVSSNLVNA